MRLAEIHTSELTSSCLRKVYHRLAGETTGEATTALYRGLVAGRAVELVHQNGFDSDPVETTIVAAADTHKTLAVEGRILSSAVETNSQDIMAEITQVVIAYIKRFREMFESCTLIGTEVPCRITLDGFDYASHIDLMVRDDRNVFGYGKGKLLVFDWKWREQQPSYHYLARNMQFSLYYLMVKKGSIMCEPSAGDMGWVEFGEEPILIWLHLPSLKPYGRKVVSKNDRGVDTEYKRGDLRPTRSILHSVEYNSDQDDAIELELRMRAKMIENDIFPLNPDPVSCRICDAEPFCTRFDLPQL